MTQVLLLARPGTPPVVHHRIPVFAGQHLEHGQTGTREGHVSECRVLQHPARQLVQAGANERRVRRPHRLRSRCRAGPWSAPPGRTCLVFVRSSGRVRVCVGRAQRRWACGCARGRRLLPRVFLRNKIEASCSAGCCRSVHPATDMFRGAVRFKIPIVRDRLLCRRQFTRNQTNSPLFRI